MSNTSSHRATIELQYGTDTTEVHYQTPRKQHWAACAVGASLFLTGVGLLNLSAFRLDSDQQTLPKVYKEFDKSVKEKLNPQVDPCNDFYEYACGGWLENTKLPKSASSIDTSFSVVIESNEANVKDIMQNNPPLIGSLYHSCITAPAVDKKAIDTISAHLEHIHSLDSADSVLEYAGQLFALTGSKSFFTIEVGADEKNATQLVLEISQGGLTFPSKEYYATSDEYSDLFISYVQALSDVSGFAYTNVERVAVHILELETEFAKASKSNAELRDPIASYNPVQLETLVERYPHIAEYLKGSGIYDQLVATKSHVLLPTPSFFDLQNKYVAALSDLDALKYYVSFHLLDSQASLLGEKYRQAHHAFHGALQGLNERVSRKYYCSAITQNLLGDYVGEYYMNRVWDTATRDAAQELVREIEQSMGDVLARESWLDEPTRQQALDKLHNVFNLVGGPSEPAPLSFNISATNYYVNVLNFKEQAARFAISSIGSKVDPNSWGMTASTVNAYYDPSANKMVFPAAIMQAPFYSANKLPDVANYARIGMVMGHELSHGFDDQGRNYDSQGDLHAWWSVNVSHTYDEKATCLAEQYSTFEVRSLDNTKLLGHVNGRLTLGENIADNGGLKLAYLAYLASKSSDLFETSEQKAANAKLYFISFAQGWCEKRSDGYAQLLMNIDPHSPGKWRVNGPIMNSALFADTFQCPLGSPMNPTKKCVVW